MERMPYLHFESVANSKNYCHRNIIPATSDDYLNTRHTRPPIGTELFKSYRELPQF